MIKKSVGIKKSVLMALPVPILLALFKLNDIIRRINIRRINRWIGDLFPIPMDLVPMHILPGKYESAIEILVAQRQGQVFGDYLEFGVSQGGSLSCMHRAAKSSKLNSMRFFGFDSFEGLPDETDSEDGHSWFSGEFYSTTNWTTAFLINQGVDVNDISLIKGWFDDTCAADTLEKYQITKAGIINIDCDIYSSTKIALDFCRPLIKEDVIIFFDDWNSWSLADKGLGEKKAFEEFLADNPRLSATELPELKYNEWSTAFYVKVSD
jgi:hypothetical protein